MDLCQNIECRLVKTSDPKCCKMEQMLQFDTFNNATIYHEPNSHLFSRSPEKHRTSSAPRLKSTPQKCSYYLERSRNKQKRPLLSGDGDIELLLTEQLADRAPFYEIAHLTLDAANKELHELVDELELISYGPATTDRSY